MGRTPILHRERESRFQSCRQSRKYSGDSGHQPRPSLALSLSQAKLNFDRLVVKEIGSRVGRNQTTVMRICDRWMQEGTTDRRDRSHQPQCATSREDRTTDVSAANGAMKGGCGRQNGMCEPVLLPYLQGLATTLFQQDNARPHVARIVQRFFVNHQIELLPWPARSLDLSPIENMWSMVAE
ncbi:hypothetical protein TNCV_4184701 [Trichonephila clavipes]|nr:hypothetical protein TNCV_4184701 [Trichonephila clavipes]